MGLLFTALYAPITLAAHEVYHRYPVQGFVIDTNNQRLDNAGVAIVNKNKVPDIRKSNRDGFCRGHLPLHDPDIGRRLVVRTDKFSETIQMAVYRQHHTTGRARRRRR